MKSLEHITVEAGTYLFREGGGGEDKAYIINSGKIEIVKGVSDGEQVVITVLGKGEVIGEMSLLDDQPHSTTARVTVKAELTVITRDAIEERMKNADPILRRLLLVLVSRLREQTRATAARTQITR